MPTAFKRGSMVGPMILSAPSCDFTSLTRYMTHPAAYAARSPRGCRSGPAPRNGDRTERENPETVATDEARFRCERPSTGRCRTQGPRQWVFKSLAGGLWEKKVRMNFLTSHVARHQEFGGPLRFVIQHCARARRPQQAGLQGRLTVRRCRSRHFSLDSSSRPPAISAQPCGSGTAVTRSSR